MQKGGDEAGAQAAFSGIFARSRKVHPDKAAEKAASALRPTDYALRLL